jgi:mycothiol system anti-sigma-R factor
VSGIDDVVPPWEAGGPGSTNCDDAVAELYAFLDGELTDQRRAAIAEHLDGCSSCRQARQFETDLRQVVADRCRDRVPQNLLDRVAAAIEGTIDGEG